MTNIFVRIIGEFKDKEFKRADKYTTKLDKNFNNLRRSATRAFIAVAGISALKRSVKAFAEEDAAVQKLTKSLDNLGLRFESGGIDEYLENLEKATTVTKEQLYPAFQQLANTTLSVTKSQQLLNSALDISAGTGKDLTVVVTALSRAFNGNFTSLGRLQTSYTTAQLEAMGFEKTVATLSTQFSGAAAASADTYQGKIARLNIALGDAQEAIGEGIVDALETLGGGNYEQGLELIASAGEKIGDAFRFAASGVAYFKRFWRQGLFATKDQLAEFRRDMSTMFTEDPAKQRTLMRERAKYLAAERKETEKIRREREKSVKLLEKEKNNQKIIAEAQKKFDMERIQIEAALQGKINDVEEYRLKLQRAILNENVDNVIKYTGLLQEAEAQAAELADLLARLPEMAENPFTDWPATIARIQYLLKELDFQIPIDVLFAEKGLKLDQDKMTVTKLETMQVSANNVYVNGALSGNAQPQFSAPSLPWAGIDMSTPAGSLSAAVIAVADALAEENAAAVALAESESAIAEFDAGMAEFDALMALIESGAIFDTTPSTTINVTVEGNVTSDYDLAQTIINEQYQYQRSGGKLTFNQVAI
jgi:hypothetical protein